MASEPAAPPMAAENWGGNDMGGTWVAPAPLDSAFNLVEGVLFG